MGLWFPVTNGQQFKKWDRACRGMVFHAVQSPPNNQRTQTVCHSDTHTILHPINKHPKLSVLWPTLLWPINKKIAASPCLLRYKPNCWHPIHLSIPSRSVFTSGSGGHYRGGHINPIRESLLTPLGSNTRIMCVRKLTFLWMIPKSQQSTRRHFAVKSPLYPATLAQ